jgi:hypothetical protein
MAAMPAGIREGVQDAVVVSGQQYAADSRGLGALVTGVGDLVAAADAEPAAAEEMSLFPLEDRRVGVGGAREHPALAERAERRGESRGVERGGWRNALAGQAALADRVVLAHHIGLTEHIGLTDHTVNAKRSGSGCLAPG